MLQVINIQIYKVLGALKYSFSRYNKWEHVIKNIATFTVFGGFAVGAFFFSLSVTRYLIEDLHIGLFLFHRFISMALFVFFLTVCLGNILVTYSNLFRSREVGFLFSLPVPHGNVLLVKFIDSFFHSSSTFFIMGAAIIAGYAYYFDFSWYKYPILLMSVFFPFLFLAACIGIILLLAFIQLTRSFGVKKLVVIFVLGYLSAILLFFYSVSPAQLVEDVLHHFPEVDQYFSGLDPWFSVLLPSHWVSEIMYWFVMDDYMRAAYYLFITVGAGIVSFAIVIVIGKNSYYPAWLISLQMKERETPGSDFLTRLFPIHRSDYFAPTTNVILKRDILRFFRDATQWIHLLFMIALASIFVISVGSLKVQFQDPFLEMVTFLTVNLFAAFLIAAMAIRFIYPMMSLEGEALWSIRSAPVPINKLFYLKGYAGILILTPLTIIISAITGGSIFPDRDLVILSLVAQILIVVTLVCLTLGLGTYFANYGEKNPVKIASSQGATLTFFISLIYFIVLISAQIPFLPQYFEGRITGNQINSVWLFFPIGIAGAISVIFSYIPVSLGLRSLKRDV